MSFSLRLPGHGIVLSLKNVSMGVPSVSPGSLSEASFSGGTDTPPESDAVPECEVVTALTGLDDVTLTLRSGTFYSVLTNKPSPILRVMARLSTPESGLIRWSMPLLKRFQGGIVAVAYVSHLHSIPSALSVEDEFLRTLAAAGTHIDEDTYENLMHVLSVNELRSHSCVNLSALESLRVATMRSVLLGARIVLFEEPTNGLSQREAEEFFMSVHGLTDSGYTVVIQTRSPDIAGLASQTFLFNDGRVVGAFDSEDISVLKAEYTKFSALSERPISDAALSPAPENASESSLPALTVGAPTGEDPLIRPMWQPTRFTGPHTLTPLPSATLVSVAPLSTLPSATLTADTGSTLVPDETNKAGHEQDTAPLKAPTDTLNTTHPNMEEFYPSTSALPLIPHPHTVAETDGTHESQAVIERAQDILKDLPGSILPADVTP